MAARRDEPSGVYDGDGGDDAAGLEASNPLGPAVISNPIDRVVDREGPMEGETGPGGDASVVGDCGAAVEFRQSTERRVSRRVPHTGR